MKSPVCCPLTNKFSAKLTPSGLIIARDLPRWLVLEQLHNLGVFLLTPVREAVLVMEKQDSTIADVIPTFRALRDQLLDIPPGTSWKVACVYDAVCSKVRSETKEKNRN